MPETVLYRKYRPTSFANIVGQTHIVEALTRALKDGRVGHAYIFSGSRGTGKTTLARLLALAVNYGDGNTSDEAKDFLAGKSFDLIELDAASNNGVDDMRELSDAVRFAPARAKRKVYILDEAHMLSKNAWNALLKTLEEPPEHAMFILCTTELEKIPDTIRSRCEEFVFERLAFPLIQREIERIAKCEGTEVSPDVSRLLALLAEGSLRDALSLLGQTLSAGGRKITADIVTTLFGLPPQEEIGQLVDAALAGDAKRAFAVIADMATRGTEARMVTKLMIEDVHYALLLAVDPAFERVVMSEMTEEHLTQLKKFGMDAGVARLEEVLRALLEAHHSPYTTVIPHLPLELAMVKVMKTPTT